MKTTARPSALCGACKYAATCKHRGEPERPVLWCEDFEFDESRDPRILHAWKKQTRAQLESIGASDEFAGLCVNCGNRHHCTHPKPEGGVWYCEEYV